MIKHVVIWNLKESACGNSRSENARLLKQKLEALAGRIPGLERIEVGININTEGDAGDVVLYSEFEDAAALDAYLKHPEHVAIAPFAREVRENRRVVDYEGDRF